MAQAKFEQIKLIRDRLVERAASGSPAWAVPFAPSARRSANAVMIGSLLRRVPDEDASALCQSVIHEQNDDGSWSAGVAGQGDLSATLEIVEALSMSSRPEVRSSLQRTVTWLESNQRFREIEWETLVLLSAITGVDRGRWFAGYRHLLNRNRHRQGSGQGPLIPSMRHSCRLLSLDNPSAADGYTQLLRRQRTDGSWDGLARPTVFALAALRHAGLDLSDSALERGWRFLRSHQHWGTTGLVQNPADISNLLHASAVRSLLMAGTSANAVAGSTLSMLHSGRSSGGWGAGSQLPTDLFTTSLALEALVLTGDVPVETAWSRRRAAMLLIRTQHRSGGWPLYLRSGENSRFRRAAQHLGRSQSSSLDTTAIAVSALLVDRESAVHHSRAIDRAARYLLRRQQPDGLWHGDVVGDPLFSSAKVVEALGRAAPERSRGAVLRALRSVRDRQNVDGGWGTDDRSTPAQTAWAVRALQQVPGLFRQSISRARHYLLNTLDESGLVWCCDRPVVRLHVDPDPIELWDLTTIWVLEAFLPAPRRARWKPRKSARSIFDRRA